MSSRLVGARRLLSARALRKRAQKSSSSKRKFSNLAEPTENKSSGGGIGFSHLLFAAIGAGITESIRYLTTKDKASNSDSEGSTLPSPPLQKVQKKSKLAPPKPAESKVSEEVKAAKEDERPAAVTAEGVRIALFEEFQKMANDTEAEEISKFDAKSTNGPDGEALSIGQTSLPPKSLEEANELIALLEAFNRGLMAKIHEDHNSYNFKEKTFKQIAPIFVRESERMIDSLKEQMAKQQTARLEEMQAEYLRQIYISLEQQKHSLFAEYQNRAKELEAKYEVQLKKAAAELKLAFDFKTDYLLAQQNKFTSERIEQLKSVQGRATKLDLMLDHAITAQKQGEKVWQMSLCLMDVEKAIKSTQPFLKQWKDLLEASKGDMIIETAIQAVPPSVVAEGIPAQDELTDRFFNKVESSAREAALVDEANPAKAEKVPASFLSYFLAKITSVFLVPQRCLVDGDNPEQIISRAGYFVSTGQLAEATKELETLEGEPAKITKDWVASVQGRLTVEDTIDVIKARMAHLELTVDRVRRNDDSA